MITPGTLHKVAPFNQMSPQEAARTEQSASLRCFQAGEIVSRSGDSCRDLYILQSGCIRVFKLSPDGREQELEVARAGDVFVGPPVFCGCPRAATGQAQDDATLIVVPQEELLRLVESYPGLATHILKFTCARMRRLTSLAAELSSKNVVRRLAWLLLDACPCTDHQHGNDSHHVTEARIAARLGSTQETVSRALGQLRERGIVHTRRQEVIVADVTALRRVAAGLEARL